MTDIQLFSKISYSSFHLKVEVSDFINFWRKSQ
jgi:hypothetical protein